MFRIQITAEDKGAVLTALKKNRVKYLLDSCVQVDRGARAPGRAAEIYRLVKEGLIYQEVANKTGVSYATVIRVIQNPKRYGLEDKPIQRMTWRR